MTKTWSRRLLPIWLVAALLAALAVYVRVAPPALADTGTLTTDDQLWVNQAAPASTNCTNWSQVHGSATAQKRTVVSFNTAGFVPAGNTVTAATLRVYPGNNYSGNNLSVKSYVRGTPGCNLTWNNLGTVGSQVGISSGNLTKNVYKSITLDPASISTSGRTGFVLDASAASLMEFRSDGAGGNFNPSKLDLTWAPTPTTTTTTTTTLPPGCTGVDINPGENIQAAVDANPTNTTFCLQPGTHRVNNAVAPKAGNKFIGDGLGVIVSGRKVITGWAVTGSTWTATGDLPPTGSAHGECKIAGCTLTEDVFRDGAPLLRVLSEAAVGPGKFYANYSANQLVVGDDPNGHLMEQNDAARLIAGTAANVTVKNLVLQGAANRAQTGAVGPLGTTSSGWTIEYNEIRYNHGVGTDPGGNDGVDAAGTLTVSHNFVHHNGQSGLGGNGPNNTIEFNEIAHNNRESYQGDEWYNSGWEAGGGKMGWVGTNHLVLKGNYSHDNMGPGLWCDINCGHVTVDGNYFRDNKGYGYYYEISYGEVTPGDGLKTVIKNNVTVHNIVPSPPAALIDGGGIIVSASPDVEVFGNQSYNERTCVWGFQQTRTDTPDPRGPHEIKNLNVHNNLCDMNGPDPVWSGKTGLWTDTSPPLSNDLYSAAYNNHFEANEYRYTSSTIDWFDWPSFQTFSQWQAAGHDTPVGTFTIGGALTPPSPPTLVVGPQP
jgi:hypothetical protein